DFIDQMDLKGVKEDIGMPIGDTVRITVAARFPESNKEREQAVMVVETSRPFTVDELKSGKKERSYRKNFRYNVAKIGQYTIYEETWDQQVFEHGKEARTVANTGDAWCIVQPKLIVRATRKELLQRIFERQDGPAMSESLRQSIALADFTQDLA